MSALIDIVLYSYYTRLSRQRYARGVCVGGTIYMPVPVAVAVEANAVGAIGDDARIKKCSASGNRSKKIALKHPASNRVGF